LLVVLDKGDKDNLSQSERNELKKLMQTYETEYGAGVAAKVAQML
jgi:peptide deformylase